MRPHAKAVTSSDALKTYRYLRIGMVAAVVCLAVSVGLERAQVACWQTSLSAYYYTPVRAIFVGALIAIGLALIVIKGRTLVEDACLNVAGMLAPVVAVAPTTDVGTCWSIEPIARPLRPDGTLADWVTANIDNNIGALLAAGAMGLVAASVVAIAAQRSPASPEPLRRSTVIGLALSAAALVGGWWLLTSWSSFPERAHGYAAVLMFVFLIGAVASKAWEHAGDEGSSGRGSRRAYVASYGIVAALMSAGGIAIAALGIGGDHMVLVLEAWEIGLFAVFWIIQTADHWNERVRSVLPGEPLPG